jgi:hypothetical protein
MEPDQLSSLLNEIEQLRTGIDSIQCEHPYRLNVIEELHINENGHSRILCRLLQYRSQNGTYDFLNSLLSYINITEKKNFPLKVVNPIITQEEERIDLWIRDREGGFAIILENKVCGAGDQSKQLYRYIQKTKKHGFKDEQIYVIYLPPNDYGEPSDDSWNGLKKQYEDRYARLSFQQNILLWLENDILPNIKYKDNLLLTAVIQYIDYLKIYFNLNMDKNMQDTNAFFDKFYNLSPDSELKAKALDEKIEEYQSLLNKLYAYRQQLEEEFTAKGIEKIKQKLNELQNNTKLKHTNYDLGGVQFSFEGDSYILFFGKNGNGWYVQIEKSLESKDKTLKDNIWDKVYRNTKELPRYSGNWCAYNYFTNIEDAIKIFDVVLRKFI